MEYCENKTLRQLIDSGDLDISEDKVWRLLREIAEGLEHVHSKVIMHSSSPLPPREATKHAPLCLSVCRA